MATQEKTKPGSNLRIALLQYPWIDVVFFMSLLYTAVWVAGPRNWSIHPVIVGLLLIAIPIISCVIRRDRFQDLGLRLDNLLPSLRTVGHVTLIGTVVILAIGSVAHWPLRFRPGSAMSIVTYLPWALAQQFVMQSFLYRRIESWVGRESRIAAFITALLFASAHTPNPALMLATGIASYSWCRVFTHAPNLFALTLSHSWLSVLMMAQVPNAIHHSMRVGPRFWN